MMTESAANASGRIYETTRREYGDFDLSVSRDEAYLYLLAKKRDGARNLSEERLDVGFGTLPGGSDTTDKAPGSTSPAYRFSSR